MLEPLGAFSLPRIALRSLRHPRRHDRPLGRLSPPFRRAAAVRPGSDSEVVKDSSIACRFTPPLANDSKRPPARLPHSPPHLLSERELLALILREREALPKAEILSQKLLQHFGSLCGLSRCSPEELGRFKGVGPIRAARICAAFGLARRLGSESLRRERIDCPERVFQLLGVEMRLLRQESLRVVLLDTRYQLMRVEEISRGTVNESIAHPRDIFAPVFSAAAYAFVLVHNHPSGDPAPSEADRQLTLQLSKAAKLLQVQLLDHVILGSPDNGRTPWYSFKQTGLL